MSEKTVSVKGTIYDKRTGMPLHLERGEQYTKNAQQMHRALQKSKTLNRRYVKNSTPAPARVEPDHQHIAAPTLSTHRASAKARVVTPAKGVTHFTSTAAPVHHGKVISDIGPTPHALVVSASKKLIKPQTHTIVKPSQIIKQEAITKAMAQTPAKRDHQEKTQSRHPKFKRFASFAMASLSILLLGGYLTYLSMPTISTRVAASQAGIAASYPSYQPNGYSLTGPVAYQQGRVTMTFAANASPSTYTLEQTKSGWDSSAVLDDYVRPNAGDNYETTSSNGLTIYTYDGSAAWVNRGIFYTISGDAPLSSDQIQRIATSL